MNSSGCTAFTFEEGVGCFLYNTPVSELISLPLLSPTSVSGVSSCGSAAVGRAGVCYTTNVLEGLGFYAYSASECAAACTKVSLCASWSYNLREKQTNCTLHSIGAALSACPTAVSGEPPLQRGYYYFFRYDAAAAATLSGVQTPEECMQRGLEADMSFFSYFPRTLICKLHAQGNYNRVADLNAVCGTTEDAQLFVSTTTTTTTTTPPATSAAAPAAAVAARRRAAAASSRAYRSASTHVNPRARW